jgi:hypothetical protein
MSPPEEKFLAGVDRQPQEVNPASGGRFQRMRREVGGTCVRERTAASEALKDRAATSI